MASLFLTCIGECRLVFTPVGEALSRLICFVWARAPRHVEQYVDWTADRLLWLTDISALSGP